MKLLKVLLLSSLLCGAMALRVGFADAASRKKTESSEEISRDAYIWGYPAVLLSQAKTAMLAKTGNPQKSLNHFFHAAKVPDPFLDNFLSVNPENIYSWAWVDLSKEALVMTHPLIPDRFYTVQFVDAYSNVFHTLSNQDRGAAGKGLFILTPPGWRGTIPDGALQIRSSTPEVFIFAQAFVHDAKDLLAVKKLMRQRQLIPVSRWNKGGPKEDFTAPYPQGRVKFNRNLATGGRQFLEDLRKIVEKNSPPTHAEEKEWERFQELAVPGKPGDEREKAIERGLFEGERNIQERLASGFGTKINGWSYEMKSPPFSSDFLLRAAASQKCLFSAPPDETLQMTLDADSESRQLFSSYRYLLHFEKEDLPPARTMWSLKVQDARTRSMQNGHAPVVASLNNQKAKLRYNLDGSVDILLQRTKPAGPMRSNWMPLSKNANFSLVLTLFHPGVSVLNRKYIAPSLTRVDEEERVPRQRVTQTMIADGGVPE